jgi:hypothetical protein
MLAVLICAVEVDTSKEVFGMAASSRAGQILILEAIQPRPSKRVRLDNGFGVSIRTT